MIIRGPRLGEGSLGAVIGTVTGAVGGLLAVGIPVAIVSGDIRMIAQFRTLAIVGVLLCAPLGWLVGGQLGPRLGMALRHRHAEIVGGLMGGLAPVLAMSYWAWSKMHG